MILSCSVIRPALTLWKLHIAAYMHTETRPGQNDTGKLAPWGLACQKIRPHPRKWGVEFFSGAM